MAWRMRALRPVLRRCASSYTSTNIPTELSDDAITQMLKGKQDVGLLRELMNARVHMGHRTHLTSKSMYPYVLGERNGMHVINLDKTVVLLRRALSVLREMTANKCSVMWVAPNDEEIFKIIRPFAEKAGAYLMKGRWVPGSLTNPIQTQQALRYGYKMPGCLFIFNPRLSDRALREAVVLSIPIVAIADTDSDPALITYPIPGNDESMTAIRLYASLASHAMIAGRASLERKQRIRR